MKDFELLLLDGTNPSGVSMTRDILAAAALLAARNDEAVPSWGLYSPTGGRVRLQGGIGADTARLPARRRAQHSILLVPGLWVADASELRARLDSGDCRAAIRLIAAHDIQRTLSTFESLYRGKPVTDPVTDVAPVALPE